MRTILAVAAVLAMIAVGAVAFAPVSSADSGLVFNKCSGCHSMKRVCRELGKKNLAEWTETVKRMVDLGTSINAGQVKTISKTLADEKPDGSVFCR